MKPEKSASEAQSTNSPFSLSTLLTRFMEKQSRAHESGLASALPEGEVLPYDAGPVQVVEPKQAWVNAIFALDVNDNDVNPCPEWGTLVAAQEPALAVAFCAGNFPQMVRNFLPMLQENALKPKPLALAQTLNKSAYLDWSENSTNKDWPTPLLAAAVLRLAQEFDKAEEVLEKQSGNIPENRKIHWLNERASLEWHRGNHEVAARQWQSMEPTSVVLFNRGMSNLFLGQSAQAHTALTEAVTKIPETTSWHHLAQLYLTLSAMKA